jgi:hypothetical protein
VDGIGGSGFFIGGTQLAFAKLEIGGQRYSNSGFTCDYISGQCHSTGYGVASLDARGGLQWSLGHSKVVSLCPTLGYFREAAHYTFPSWVSDGPIGSVALGFRLQFHSTQLRPFVEAGVWHLQNTDNFGNPLIGDIILHSTETDGFIKPGIGVSLNQRISVLTSVLIPLVADRLITTRVTVSFGFGGH